MFDLPDSSLTRTRRSLPTRRRVDVLVAAGVLADAVDVHPPLVGERAGADERLAGPEVHVRRLVDVTRDLRQVRELLGRKDVVALVLQGEVGDHAAEVDVAAALADAVDRPLHLGRALLRRRPGCWRRPGRSRCGCGCRSGPTTARRTAATASATSSGRAPPLVSQRTSQAAPAVGGGLEGLQGVVGVALEAVEEVLGVVDHLGDVRGEEGDRVGDHPQVLVERDAQDLAGLEVPALADDRHGRGRRRRPGPASRCRPRRRPPCGGSSRRR